MVLRGLTWLVLFQLLGSGLNVLCLSLVPGPIIGLILLFFFLLVRGEVGEALNSAASSLLRYLPLLMIPPSVGLIQHVPELRQHIWALSAALLVSVCVSLAFSGWLMQALIERKLRRENKDGD